MIPMLEISNLTVSYFQRGKSLSAVRGASLSVRQGSAVALVGESGSGKSTVALSVMGSECVNSPFIVSVNLDAMSACFEINPGDGTWNDMSDPIVIQDLIDENFKDDITGYRLYDIRVKVTDSLPSFTLERSWLRRAILPARGRSSLGPVPRDVDRSLSPLTVY